MPISHQWFQSLPTTELRSFLCIAESFSLAQCEELSAKYITWHRLTHHLLWSSWKDHSHIAPLRDLLLIILPISSIVATLSGPVHSFAWTLGENVSKIHSNIYLLQLYKSCLLFCLKCARGLQLCVLPFSCCDCLRMTSNRLVLVLYVFCFHLV